jgi:MarR-like DNA-binding transcriptional regulator SgrR of sgrS sRNA
MDTTRIKKNRETLIDASKQVGLEINVYRLLTRHQNIGQNRDIKIASRSFENLSHFKYFGMTVSNKSLTHKEIKKRLISDKACYHSVQRFSSSHLLFRSVKIVIQKTIILPVVLYGCETCSLTLKEEHRLRVFEKKVLRRIFGSKRLEVTGEWRKIA